MPRALNLAGQRFGRLFALEDMPGRQGGKIVWRCICDCGAETLAVSTALTSGNTRSCGCIRGDAAVARGIHLRRADPADLRRLRDEGLNGREIARRLGVTPSCVQQWFRRLGEPLPGPRNGHCGVGRVKPEQRYGRLAVLRPAPREGRAAAWYCRCDCGRICPIRASVLLAGKTRSCGCVRQEGAAERCGPLGRAAQDVVYDMNDRYVARKADRGM